jgi:hypothetical protein
VRARCGGARIPVGWRKDASVKERPRTHPPRKRELHFFERAAAAKHPYAPADCGPLASMAAAPPRVRIAPGADLVQQCARVLEHVLALINCDTGGRIHVPYDPIQTTRWLRGALQRCEPVPPAHLVEIARCRPPCCDCGGGGGGGGGRRRTHATDITVRSGLALAAAHASPHGLVWQWRDGACMRLDQLDVVELILGWTPPAALQSAHACLRRPAYAAATTKRLCGGAGAVAVEPRLQRALRAAGLGGEVIARFVCEQIAFEQLAFVTPADLATLGLCAPHRDSFVRHVARLVAGGRLAAS